ERFRLARAATALLLDVEADVTGQPGQPGLDVEDLCGILRQLGVRDEHRPAHGIVGVGMHAPHLPVANRLEVRPVDHPEAPECVGVTTPDLFEQTPLPCATVRFHRTQFSLSPSRPTGMLKAVYL